MLQPLPTIPEIVAVELRAALRQSDAVAYYNVTHDNDGNSILDASGAPVKGRFPRGGPFGAGLVVSYGDRAEQVGRMDGNNVVGSGIASAHAEDQALQQANYGAVIQKLTALKSEGLKPVLWVISSGQSCITCHSKEEIMVRDMVARELIEPGHAAVIYGATYDATFDIAKFNDAPYADAIGLYAAEPENPGNLIKSRLVSFGDAPWQVKNILGPAVGPTAVVMRHGDVYVQGEDSREDLNPYATAEISAVRAACGRYRRDEGKFESWEIDGELWTTELELGPCLFAEMGWTRIKTVNHIRMPSAMQDKQFRTRETPLLSNRAFLQIIASGYGHSDAALHVYRDAYFENTAQPMWGRVLQTNPEMLYNGDGVSNTVLKRRNSHTRFRFAGQELCCACGQGPLEPQPLAPIACEAVPGGVGQ